MPGYRRLFSGTKKKLLRVLPDKQFIKLLYKRAYGYFPNLHNPKTFDEKIQWYKLYYRNPVITALSDKYEVRKHIENKGLASILNELYGVYDHIDEMDFSRLPPRFVIKATHGSAMNIICKNKESLDWGECRRTMKKWLKRNYFYCGREWAYKNIKPRLICEKYLENEEFQELIDYKFYCFNNKPEVLFVCAGRFSDIGLRYDAFDMKWNRIQVYKGKPGIDLAIKKPDNLQSMIDAAHKLCQGFPYVRVDLYSVKQKVIFGELTFYPDSGFCPFTPDSYNYFFGNLFILPEKQ